MHWGLWSILVTILGNEIIQSSRMFEGNKFASPSSLLANAIVLPVPCPVGTYRDGGVKIGECRPCPRGVYGDSPGLTSRRCTAPCPKGTYNDFPGGKNILVCKLCPAGVYGDREGLESRACSGPCPKGKYSNQRGLTNINQCLPCPPYYRGANGRRGNNPLNAREGGYPCDSYLKNGVVVQGLDAAMDEYWPNLMETVRKPRNEIINPFTFRDDNE